MEERQKNNNLKRISIREERDNTSGKLKNEAEMRGKTKEARQGLKMSHLVNPTKEKNRHYMPVLLGSINFGLGKAKFHSNRILLYYGSISFIVLGKNTKIT